MALILVLLNLPWAGLWWYFTGPEQDRGLGVVALYMILAISAVGMVILPIFVGGTQGKRWLLLLVLGIINLFWCLRWISVFADTSPADANYAGMRYTILQLMALSSAVVTGLYLATNSLIRPPHTPGDPAATD